MGEQAVTLRYEDGTAAVHSDAHGAVAQAVHDLWLPGQGTPVAVLEGDLGEDHTDTRGQPRPLKDLPVLLAAKDLRAAPKCACEICEMHRRGPKIAKLHAQLAELLAPPVVAVDENERELMRWLSEHPRIKGAAIPAGGFEVTWTAVALSAATAKTIVGFLNAANNTVSIAEAAVSGDATSGNLLIELVFGTNATNAPGTNSTSFTPLLGRGSTQTLNSTAGVTWTSEPTVLTVLKRWQMPWPGGPFVIQSPLSREINGVVTASTSGKFVGLRLTSSVSANTHGYAEIEE